MFLMPPPTNTPSLCGCQKSVHTVTFVVSGFPMESSSATKCYTCLFSGLVGYLFLFKEVTRCLRCVGDKAEALLPPRLQLELCLECASQAQLALCRDC
jgi:hypothetical protein